ncbi:phd and ring finger domain protein [Grosmannia clavigera kw1407]|uniref:Phd and ring finger domain protein n=1 Tax=Grosmannia clavigera (strain kw1407 / UAMH 11150) TaxID=655863 RepID=F0XS75_GROCL|nr:phd and ring finger domain protein [Grosmannia clavigera kw1407]EFW99656.1 phd and ring finger domain protein [Grosmannia clavigera kw1407]
MAEQCIVCLDPLLHAEEPPPPPEEVKPAPNSPNATSAIASGAIIGDTTNNTGPFKEDADGASHPRLQAASDSGVCVYDKIGGNLLSSYKVQDKKQVAEFDPQAWLDEFAEVEADDISTPCPVCNLADNEEVLLLCDGCDTPYHTHCIGLENVPQGAWFCMECIDLLGQAIPGAATDGQLFAGAPRRLGPQRARNDFFPRTRQSMRRARRRAQSDEWQGAWGQITGRIWDVLNIDLDHDEDESLEDYRRAEQLRNNERREFERWQERLDIARRLGAQDVFERNIPSAILQRGGRHTAASQNGRVQTATVQQSREEIRSWGAFERARDCDVSSQAARKRKARSITASPVEPVQEPERKLKRPRTRRITAPPGEPSSSKSAVPGSSSDAPAAISAIASGSSSSAAATLPSRTPQTDGEPRSFLSSLLKEVESSTPSDDETIRNLFGEPRPSLVIDPSSPVASSPAASPHNSPRAMSTTPPPHRALRPSSPTLLSSHIEPIYPPANYSPTRSAVSPRSDHSDSENNNGNISSLVNQASANHNGSTFVTELRQPRPQRRPTIALPRSEDVSPSRNPLSLEMKESISSIVRAALKPHWKSSQLTADQYAAINRDVSHKLYEEVSNPVAADSETRKLWEKKASKEVAQAVADLSA